MNGFVKNHDDIDNPVVTGHKILRLGNNVSTNPKLRKEAPKPRLANLQEESGKVRGDSSDTATNIPPMKASAMLEGLGFSTLFSQTKTRIPAIRGRMVEIRTRGMKRRKIKYGAEAMASTGSHSKE